MKVVVTVIGTLVVLAVLGLLVMFSGIYDISAVSKHNALTLWVLDEGLENSVEHHAKGITPPASLTDSAVVAGGFRRFDRMCAGCHGAPGAQRRSSRITYPAAPPLAAVVDEWKPAELFWITKNGIKMTGMPAFAGETDEDLWSIVAFMQKLPDIQPEQYQAMHQAAMAADSASAQRFVGRELQRPPTLNSPH